MFEDLLRNSKVHTLLMKNIVRRSLARIKAEFEPENDTEDEQEDHETGATEVQEKLALRQQFSLKSHIVPATIKLIDGKIPTNHGSVHQKLLKFNPSFRNLAEEGRWLVFDQFLLRVEKHFETVWLNDMIKT